MRGSLKGLKVFNYEVRQQLVRFRHVPKSLHLMLELDVDGDAVMKLYSAAGIIAVMV